VIRAKTQVENPELRHERMKLAKLNFDLRITAKNDPKKLNPNLAEPESR
jgi:hypothetical protein